MDDKNGWTPLHVAAWRGDTAAAEMLIDNGAEVNAKDNNGLTPMQAATFMGETETVQMLITRGGK